MAGEDGREQPPARLPARRDEAAGTAVGAADRRPKRALPQRAEVPDRSVGAPLSAEALARPVLDEAERGPLWLVTVTLLRLTAVAWVAGAIVLWSRLVGYSETVAPGFQIPDAAELTTIVASLVAPVVAVGLWLAGLWGLVVWAAALIGGVVVLALRPELVPFGGAGPAILAGNIAVAVTVAALAAVRAVLRRRAE